MSASFAHTGSVVQAFPIEGAEIDGDLSEWPDGLPSAVLEGYTSTAPMTPTDLDVSFQVAIDIQRSRLLVAVQVIDDDLVTASTSEDNLFAFDSCTLFFDPEHHPDGSEPITLIAGLRGSELELVTTPPNWRERAEVAVRREGNRTIYEWALGLEGPLAFRTVGLEFAVSDRDDGATGARQAIWGGFSGANQRGGLLGDVMLFDAATFPGTLTGSLSWDDQSVVPGPRVVRIDCEQHPEMWCHASLAGSGQFRIDVPTGDYQIMPAYGLTDPFEGSQNPRMVDRSGTVSVRVEAGESSRAEPLAAMTFDAPRAAEEDLGLLSRFGPGDADTVDFLIESLQEFYGIPGVSLAIVKDGELAYHRTYGLESRIADRPVKDETLFEAASITKAVFAFAVMRLAERGVIDLDKPLFEYLPFPNIAGDERSKVITARTVLTHRTGLPNWAFGGPGGWKGGEEIRLEFDPGTQHGYSGEGFNYLGRVLEHITGTGLEELLQREVAQPMGMKQTHFSNNPRLAAVASKGHYGRYTAFRGPIGMVSPASSMHTEARDMAHFMLALHERRGLKPETYEELMRPHYPIESDDPSSAPTSIALGFFVRETPHGTFVGHGGNNGDFRCRFGVSMDSGTGYAVFTNSNHGELLIVELERLLTGS